MWCLSKFFGVEKFSPQFRQWHLRPGCQPAVQAALQLCDLRGIATSEGEILEPGSDHSAGLH